MGKTTAVQRVFARGRAFFNPLFTVKFLAITNEPSRFTVVVSTKVSKSAVKRNRLKRLIREFIRLNIKSFRTGDYAIVIKPAAAAKESKELVKKFEELCRSGKLLT